MLKFKRGRMALCIFTLACLGLGSGVVHFVTAENDSSWLTSNLHLIKIKDIASTDIPTTFFGSGNIDCTVVYEEKCSIDTPSGSIWSSSTWLDGRWRPIRDFGGNSSAFFAIPNSETAFTTSSPPGFGSYIFFTDNTSLSLMPHYLVGSQDLGAGLNYFQLNRSYDRKLADRSGKLLAADLNSMAFSGSSKWMVATDPGIANLRVDLNTGEVLPFGKAFAYGSGQNPVPKNAITSDGRYALEASKDNASFTVYDLSTCAAVPDSISRPVSCAGRELINSGYLASEIPGYSGTLYARFINDSSLEFYASYKDGGTTKYASYLLSTKPDNVSQLQYLALGDSYISGEGAFDYKSGTDTDANKCHLSPASYPYLIGHDLNYDSYGSVACSGATTSDIIDERSDYPGQTTYKITKAELQTTPQFDNFLTSFSPGWIDQLEFVREYQPRAITVSIGGNDMGFSKILEKCVAPWDPNTCYSTYEDRAELIKSINDTVFPNLVKTYTQLKRAGRADMYVYAIGYPQIALPGGNCAVNVQLNNDELIFAQQLISYLDGVIKDAADRVGVKYVDTQDALDGHRLCEAGPGSVAMNGITAGNDRPYILGGPIGDESYHPNKIGYRLIEEKVLADTNNMTDPMPAANPTASAPDISSDIEILNGVPHSGRSTNSIEYDPSITGDFVYSGNSISVDIDREAHSLSPGITLTAELHSIPIELGKFQANSSRNLTAQVMIPADAQAGYHVLHFYGTDVANQPIDIYKTIYIAAAADDIDGNGIPDFQQSCVGIPASGQDYDRDGIDDACDGDIGTPPASSSSADSSQETVTESSDEITSPQTLGNSHQVTDNDNSNQIAVADPQDENTSGEISMSGSNTQERPAVLAATTLADPEAQVHPAKKVTVAAGDYWLAMASLPILTGLAFAAKRWVF